MSLGPFLRRELATSVRSERAFNADFHGRENNQPFWGRRLRFLGDLAIFALGSLIVYLAKNDSIGIKSTLAVPCILRYISSVFPGFRGPT